MKIAEVSAVYPPYRGGIGTVARDNARMAQDGGWNVVVYTPQYPMNHTSISEEQMRDGIVIERLKPVAWYGNAAVMLGLPMLLKDADIIHLHYPCIGSEWLAVLASLIFKKKLLVTYHMDLVGKGLFRPIFWVYTKIFLPLVAKSAHHVFVTSWDYSELSHLRRFLTKRKHIFSELPCVVDTSRFIVQSKSDDILTRHGLSSDALIALFVGGLDAAHYFKGVDLLIDVFASLSEDIRESHLVVVGDGNMRLRYESHVERLGLCNRVHFAGSVSDEELPLYYALADVCVLPSLDESEAFGIALVEAFSCGKPVIASRSRGVRSVVRDGIDGILIQPGSPHELSSALRTLLTDNEKRNSMGRAARENAVQRYAYDTVKAHFQKIITHLTSEIDAA